MKDFIKYIRFNDWWNYVIPPIIAWYFFSVWFYQQDVLTTFIDGLLLLILAFATAAFGFVLNDLTDQEEDVKKGKVNYLSQLPNKYVFLLILGTLMLQAGVLFLLQPGWLIWVHVGQVSIFVVYSLPPIRLKGIWWLAPILDAIFSGTLYYVFAFFLIPVKAGYPFEMRWMMILVVWGLVRGSRNILWHLYKDAELDKRAKYETIVHHRSVTPKRIERFTVLLNVVELGIFATFLVFLDQTTYLWWVTGGILLVYILWKNQQDADKKFTINNLILEVYLPVISVVALSRANHVIYLVLLLALAIIFPTIRSWFMEIINKSKLLWMKMRPGKTSGQP